MMAGNFSDSQKQALTQQLRSVLLQTEHSGNTSTLYTFSQAGGGEHLFIWAIAILLGILNCGYATTFPVNEHECLAMATTHSSYNTATHRVMKISEVQRWKVLVEKNKRHIAWIPSSDNTVFHDGQCFWEINLYEDAGNQLLRWNSYQIGLNKPVAYRLDAINPEQVFSMKFPSSKKAGVANE
jgi:hypothetical protein